MAQKGKEIFSQDFEARSLPKISRTGTGDWKMLNGVITGQELAASHHATFRKLFLDHQNVVYQFDFKIEGTATARFMINYELVHVAKRKKYASR